MIFENDVELVFDGMQIDPPGRAPGVCWMCGLYDKSGFLTHPVAVAYVTNYSQTIGAVLDFVFVPDMLRRKGYAKALIKRCMEFWPGLIITDGVTEAGDRLVHEIASDLTRDTMNYDSRAAIFKLEQTYNRKSIRNENQTEPF